MQAGDDFAFRRLFPYNWDGELGVVITILFKYFISREKYKYGRLSV